MSGNPFPCQVSIDRRHNADRSRARSLAFVYPFSELTDVQSTHRFSERTKRSLFRESQVAPRL